MRISIASGLFEHLSQALSSAPLDVEFTHSAAFDAMPQVDWAVQSLSATQIVATRPGGYSLTLSGTGISPVTSLAALEQAIDNGIATGAFSSLILSLNGVDLVTFTIEPTGITMVSDPATVQVNGLIPTSLQQLFQIAGAEASGDLNTLVNVLTQYDIDGFSVSVGGDTQIELVLSEDGITFQLPQSDLRLTIPGNYPGDLGELLAAVTGAQEEAGPENGWSEILFTGFFGVSGLHLTDLAGNVLLSVDPGDGSPEEDENVWLIDQQMWWPTDWIQIWLPRLLFGEFAFPRATPGADLIDLQDMDSYVIAGDGNDTVNGGSGDDEINGNRGDDSLSGGGGNDTIFGGPGDDTLDGGSGSDTIYGGTTEPGGNDLIRGGSSSDVIYGMVGDDTLYGDSSADTVYGGDGNDSIFGGTNADSIDGGNQNDTIYGGTSNDTIYGGQMSDQIWGEDGDDLLYGESSSDTVYGGDGNDTIHGGSSSDTLEGGNDNDEIYGGTSADVINGDDGADILDGGTSNDTIDGGAKSDLIYGDHGDDSLMGGTSSDTIYGGIDNDFIDGGSSADTLYGGDGADSILGGSSGDLIEGGIGKDTIRGGSSADTVYGGSSSDRIYGDSGDDVLYGDNSADTVYGGTGNDLIDGGSSADKLYGGSNSDTIFGGSSNDTIYGGGGSDTLTGGTGDDVFVFNTAIGVSVDTITDYDVADDTIRLDDAVFTGLALGALDASAFAIGPATTAAHRVIYDSATGALSYDADGNGAGAAVQFATLATGLALTHEDFFVI